MIKKLFTVAAITITTACAPAHAAVLGYAKFSPDGISETMFLFESHPQPKGEQCFLDDALKVTLSSGGANRGVIIARGCWNVAGNGDINVQLYEGSPVSGILSIRQEYVEAY